MLRMNVMSYIITFMGGISGQAPSFYINAVLAKGSPFRRVYALEVKYILKSLLEGKHTYICMSVIQ